VEPDSDETSKKPMSAHFLIKVAMVAGERLFKEEPMVVAVRAAIDATADQFVQLEGVRENLQKWQDSPEFAGLLARLQKAEIAPESADLAGSFISMGFYVPEKMGEVAESILDSFAENLRGELLKTDIGLQILADTAEKGLQPTRSSLLTRFWKYTGTFPFIWYVAATRSTISRP
jgi:hypothetical protein